MMDFKLLTKQLLETYLGSDTLSDVVIQDFLDSNASIIGTGKQEFFKSMDHFLSAFKFDVEKRKDIHLEFKDLEVEEQIVDDQCVITYGSVQIYGIFEDEITIMHMDSRFTVVYGIKNGQWKVLHIHHSIPDKQQMENEEFPIALGRQVQQARVESGKMELDENYDVVGNVSQLVCGAFEAEASKKHIELNRNIRVQHKNIMVDTTKMQEILSNLISNAIKYTPESGKVLIDVQELPYDKEGYTLIQTKIMDTGIGMSEEFLPSLFELFTRERNTTLSKIPGTGLGMAIVKNLVDLMNGSIEVESELGKGSTFTITIPHKIANKDYTNRNIESSHELDIDFKGKRILLAEDNVLNAEITTTILSEMGFEVKAVEDGILCVNEMQHQPANTYDLILMDIQMPNMDGYKATDCIRHLLQLEKANIPIIAMSANAFEEDKKKAFDVKMNDYITKPIDFQKMEVVLKHVLSKKDPLS